MALNATNCSELTVDKSIFFFLWVGGGARLAKPIGWGGKKKTRGFGAAQLYGTWR